MAPKTKEKKTAVVQLSDHQGAGLWRVGLLGAGLLQLVLLLLYYLPNPKRMIGDEGYYFHLARAIASGDHSAHHPFWPPLYGEIAGFVFKLFGEHVWLVQAMQILLLGVSAWLLRDVILRRWSAPLWANGVVCLFLLSPEWVGFSHYFWPEVAHLFFAMAALWFWCRWPNQLLAAGMTGFCIALALLTKLLLLPFVPLCFGAVLILAGRTWRQQLKYVAIAGVVLVVTLAPTLRKNHQRFGDYMIADSSLFNVWVGLNDSSAADYRNDIAGVYFNAWEAQEGNWQEKKAVFREKLRDQLQENGWVQEGLDQLPRQYRRLLDPQTFLVTQLPGGPRAAYTSTPSIWIKALSGYAQAWHTLVLCFAGIGLWFVRWRRPSLWWFFAGFLAYNLGLMWLVHVKTRFLIQMWPALLPFACATCLIGFARVKEGAIHNFEWLTMSRPRLIGGIFTVSILLLLMFWPR